MVNSKAATFKHLHLNNHAQESLFFYRVNLNRIQGLLKRKKEQIVSIISELNSCRLQFVVSKIKW